MVTAVLAIALFISLAINAWALDREFGRLRNAYWRSSR